MNKTPPPPPSSCAAAAPIPCRAVPLSSFDVNAASLDVVLASLEAPLNPPADRANFVRKHAGSGGILDVKVLSVEHFLRILAALSHVRSLRGGEQAQKHARLVLELVVQRHEDFLRASGYTSQDLRRTELGGEAPPAPSKSLFCAKDGADISEEDLSCSSAVLNFVRDVVTNQRHQALRKKTQVEEKTSESSIKNPASHPFFTAETSLLRSEAAIYAFLRLLHPARGLPLAFDFLEELTRLEMLSLDHVQAESGGNVVEFARLVAAHEEKMRARGEEAMREDTTSTDVVVERINTRAAELAEGARACESDDDRAQFVKRAVAEANLPAIRRAIPLIEAVAVVGTSSVEASRNRREPRRLGAAAIHGPSGPGSTPFSYLLFCDNHTVSSLKSSLCCNKVKLSPWKGSMIHANAP